MPTVAELERLDGLVRRLTPIAGVQRGELIRAEDWNAVVSALIEVLRAVLAEDPAASTAAHEHVDQVALGWLDPRVRALVERGPLSEPTAVSRVDGIDRRLSQAADRMSRLEATTREARTIASDLSVRDEKRATDLDGIRRHVEGLPDARDDIVNLRETLNGIRGDVRRAIDVGEGLRIDGQPFDAQEWGDRVRGVEELRDRWTGPDGTVLDASGLERRLTELSNTFVDRTVLDQVLDAHTFELPGSQFDALQDRLTNRLSEGFHADLDRTAGDLRTEMAEGLGRIDGIVGQKVGEAVPGLSDTVLATARAEFAAELAGTRAELVASITSQLGESEGRVLATVDGRLGGIEDRVAASVMPQIDGRIEAAVSPLRADIGRIDERGRLNADAIGRLDASQTETRTRVEVVARADEQGRKALQTALIGQIDSRLAQQAATIDARFSAIDAQVQQRLDVAIRDATNSLSAQVDQIAGTAARREAQLAAGQLRGEIREIAREEAGVAAEGLRNDFRVELDRSSERVSGLVTSEVRRQTATLPDLVRNEVNIGRGVDANRFEIERLGPG